MPVAERQTIQQVRRDRVPPRHGSPLPSTGVREAAPVQEMLLQMQRTAGNTAVTAFLQRYAARLAPPQPPARRGNAPPVIQRLVTSAQMVELAGPVSKKAKVKNSSYAQILARLDAYHLAKEPEKKTAILTEIVALCDQWQEHNKPKGSKDTRSAKDKRKDKYINGLFNDANHELKGEPPTTGLSALIATRTTHEGSPGTPDYESASATSAGNRKAPTRWVFTIAAWKQNPELLKLTEARTGSMMRNKARDFALNNALNRKVHLFATVEPKSAVPEGQKPKKLTKGLIPLAQVKNNEQQREKAARVVVEQRVGSADLDPDDKTERVQELARTTGQVGHTWVKLATYAGTELLSVTSFGFWPLDGFGAPNKPVPGVVHHPDTADEGASNVLFADYEITSQQYAQALAYATRMQGAHPDYEAAGYNCTLFAKEMMEAAKLGFPGQAYSTMGVIKTFNPNYLHESLAVMQGKKGAPEIYDTSKTAAVVDASQQQKTLREQQIREEEARREQQRQEEARREQQRREEEERRQHRAAQEAKYPLVHVLRATTLYMGENFSKTRGSWPLDANGKDEELHDLQKPIAHGLHPSDESGVEQDWILLHCLIPANQEQFVGWVKLADVDARGGSPTAPSAAPSRPRGESGEGSSSG